MWGAAIGLVVVVASGGCDAIIGIGHYDHDAPLPSSPYRDAVLADHPVGYWRLDDIGSIAHDELGMLDGNYFGGCTPVAGALATDPNRAVHFDGTCYVQLPDGLGFAGNAPFSVELWVAIESLDKTQHLFTRQRRTLSNPPLDGYAVLQSANLGPMLERTVNSMNTGTTRQQVLTVGSFAHVVAMYDGATLHLLVNGAELPSSASPLPMPDFAFGALIGVSVPATGYAFLFGAIDEVAVYDHVLDPERIALHRMLAL